MYVHMLSPSAGKGKGASVKDEGGEVGAAEVVPGGENAASTRESTGRPKEEGEQHAHMYTHTHTHTHTQRAKNVMLSKPNIT